MEVVLMMLILLIIGLLTYRYLKLPHSHFKNLNIPGPKPVFIFGNVSLDMRKKFLHEIDLERIEKYGKIVGTYVGRHPYLLVADPDVIRNILVTDFDKFCDRQELTLRGILSHCLLDVKGQKWKEQRKQIAKYFHMDNLRQNVTTINSLLDPILQDLETKFNNGELIDCQSFVGPISLQVISKVTFGIDTRDNDEVLVYAKKIFKDATKVNVYLLLRYFVPEVARILDWFNQEAVDTSYFREYIKSLITCIKQSKSKSKEITHTKDFVSTILCCMTEDEVVSNCIMFYLAGYDTTASSLSILLYNLLVNQHCQEKVYQEIVTTIGDKRPTYDNVKHLEYLQRCIQESLRLFPTGTRTTRQCVQDCVIKGVIIKKGTRIVIPIWYLHRNPDTWSNPDLFDPERFAKEGDVNRKGLCYSPFGAGPRNCIGARLAQSVMKIVVVRILQKYKLVKNLKTEVPLQLDPSAAFLLRPKNGIWLSLEKRC